MELFKGFSVSNFLNTLLCFVHAVTSTTTDSTRIVGGHDVPPGEYVPYQVSLQYFTKKNKYQHFCGGSIISPNRILTAAHCCKDFDVKRMTVLAGVRDLNDSEGVRVQVSSYDIHDNYEELVTSDIAILTLEGPLNLDGIRMSAIEVRGSDLVDGGVPVTLTGWGLRLPISLPFLPPELENINYPTILQTVNYRTITNQECLYSGMEDLTETEICARGAIFTGACSGDSGGPLVMKTSAGLHQVGIVSYGLFVCGVFTVIPDVYTRVSIFDDWIQARML
ncbi:chymotrypsin-2 [Bactrocera neohumeralis]|uniref:chymotrypsin-2 n=1 Tax=Bactrocera neohumeralis TaxID=98809 RepID=UPI002165CE43|nr:chymotrypsin-2 [Bactrocera neohumeralis]